MTAARRSHRWTCGTDKRPLRNRAALCLLLLAIIYANKTCTTTAQASPNTLQAAAEKHHLLIGTAADANHISEKPYAAVLGTQYSELEPEYELKFAPIHPEPGTYDFERPDALVAFAQAHSMRVRGHTLVWHQEVPDWVASPRVPWTPEALNKVLADHIAAVVGRYKGKIYAWDVVNEAFEGDGTLRNTVWYDQPGIGFAGQGTKTIEQALRWAHEADPDAKLFVNEYGAEVMNAKSDAVYAMAKDFVQRGVPLAGIGFQLHVGVDFNQPATLKSLRQNMERLAALGLQIQFTEIDIRLLDDKSESEMAQADTYKALLTSCLEEPACTLFQTWGFTDRYSWVPGFYHGYGWALPFDKDYKKKPAYSSMLDALKSRGYDGPRPAASR